MDNLEIIKKFVRLAAISEEIEGTDPEASNLIDETIDENANNFPDFQSKIDPALYPRIDTPEVPWMDEDSEVISDDITKSFSEDEMQRARELAESIFNSDDFQREIPEIRGSKHKKSAIERWIALHPDIF